MTAFIKYLIPFGLIFSLGLYMAPGHASINDQGKVNSATTFVRVWATAGPLAYLDNAKVTVKNDHGKVIGRGRTNVRGTSLITLPADQATITPLHIFISGGKEKGRPFTGQLLAEADATGPDAPVVFLDILSTAAYKLVKHGYTYTDAKAAVRDTLGISQTLPEDIIRTFNNHVSYTRLRTARKKSQGFINLVNRIARATLAGKQFADLKPLAKDAENRASKPSANPSPLAFNALATVASPAALTTTATTTTASTPSNPTGSSSPVCTTGVPNGTSSTSSTETLSNFGSIGMGMLLDVAGGPATAGEILGMLLTQPSNQDALTAVANELDCISSQINAISGQITALSLQVTAGQATDCRATLQTEFGNYTNMVNSAIGTGAIDGQVVPINGSNAYIVQDLPKWNTTAVTNCGAAINNMLFNNSASSGTGSYWLALNQSYQQTYKWYTSAQVQYLQSALSYWGTYSYYAFVLQNEYFNWTGPATGINESSFIQGISGAQYDINGNPQVTADNVPICKRGTTANTANYCAYQSNLVNAFPGDLYSDEIGFWDTGLAVNTYPGRLPINNYNNHGETVIPTTPNYLLSGEDVTQLFQHIFHWLDDETHDPYTNIGPCCWTWNSNNVTNPALDQFNAQGINPGHTGSAVENFGNPQAVRTLTLSSTNQDLALLKQAQTTATGALTAQSFFYNAICDGTFQCPTSVDYLTDDTVQGISWPISNPNCINSNGTPCSTGYHMRLDMNTFFSGALHYTPGPYPVTPGLGVFMGRNFWPAAASAIPPKGTATNTFTYPLPNPLNTASVVPGAVTIGTATAKSVNSIALSFTPLTLSATDLPVTYTAKCDGTGTFTATSAVSPITVTGLFPNAYYNCSIAAVNAVGTGPEVFFPNLASSYAAITSSPLQPNTTTLYRQPYPSEPTNVTGVTTALANSITINYEAPLFNGGSAITGYMASCTFPDGTYGVSPVVPSTTLVINITATAAQAKQAICSVVAVNNVYAGTGSYNGFTNNYGDPAALVVGVPLAPNNPHWWSATPGTINLSYSAPSIASASPITGYNATCTATGYPSCSATATASSYSMSLSSCALGVQYQCSVAAENASGIGTQSALKAVTVAPAIVPDTPANVSIVAATTTSITASFTEGYNGGSPITNHLLTCTNASTQLVAQAQGTASPITLSGRPAGATYNCVLEAVNAVGSSLPSSVSTVTLAAIVPAAPSISSLTATSTSITANFVEGNNGTSPITNNTLTCTNTSSGVSATATGIASPITLSGVTAGATYSCSVTAVNALGSSPSSAASSVTSPATVPDAPILTSLTAIGTSITANFTEGSNGGSSITNNTLTCSLVLNGVSATATGIASPITLSGVITGAAYSCSVTAVNAVGTSKSSAASIVIPATVPDAPTNVVYTPATTQVRATFIAPAYNGSSPITGYRLTCTNTSSGVSSSVTGTTSPVQFTINSLVSGMTYSCSMQSQNSVGYSASTTASTVTLLAGLPSAPTLTSLTATSTSITANFTEGYDGGSPITNNTLTCTKTSNGVSASATGIASPITLSGVTAGATYSCTVTAVNAYGSSPSSTASSVTLGASATPTPTPAPVTTATVPGPPTNVVYTPATTQVRATFTASTNNGGATITGYRLTCTNTSSGVSSSVTGTTSPVQFTINSLVSGMTYSCSMQSQNSVGYSASTTASTVTLLAGLPSAPTLTSLTATSTSITANFTEGYDGGSPITNNTLTCTKTSNGVSASATGIASPITLSGVTAGATYSCSVTAVNAYGSSPSSTASTITP